MSLKVVCLCLLASVAGGARRKRFSWNDPQPSDETDKAAGRAVSANAFIPSKMALRAARDPVKNFRELSVRKAYRGNLKILVLCTSEWLLPTKNGKFFNTGHHSSEMLVPMFHLKKAGFQFDIATESGNPVALEEWTFPLARKYEDSLREIQGQLKAQLDSPMTYEQVNLNLNSYAGVFVPGGHGPLISMPWNARLGQLLTAAHNKRLPTMSLCHGPIALSAARLVNDVFPWAGYKITMFPDSVDKKSPLFGYLPGYLDKKYMAQKRMQNLGVTVVNKDMDDSTYVDRELITGSSQAAAQNLAEVYIRELMKLYDFEVA
jgi:molecular chaperone Hsp31 and glyoxalase 3